MICILITNMNTPAAFSRSIGIVADDLTSAADGAGPFLPWAGPAQVCRGVSADDVPRILSLDTGSRALAEMDAAQAAADAAAALAGRDVLYKTMDSTLRGHIRAELAAAFRASGRHLLVVAPAFAGAGRVTLGGNQYVHGQLVAASVYGADPVHPARHRFDGLIATGGDTLAALLDALTIRSFTLTCELAPGFPAGVAAVAIAWRSP